MSQEEGCRVEELPFALAIVPSGRYLINQAVLLAWLSFAYIASAVVISRAQGILAIAHLGPINHTNVPSSPSPSLEQTRKQPCLHSHHSTHLRS